MNEILTRTSVRQFTNQPVEAEKMELLLKAAMQAPSAANQQPWEFVVLTEREVMEKVEKMSPYAKSLLSAPTAIVMLTKKEGLPLPTYTDQDMGACAQNIQLMCEHIGLGAVWLGVKPDQSRMDYVAEILNLPASIEVFAVLSIGYPATKREAKSRFDTSRVHYNTYTL